MVELNDGKNIEIKRDELFVNRNEVLQDIHLELKKGKKIIVCGSEGVGKSSVMVEYIYRRLDEGAIKKVFWFDADNDVNVQCILDFVNGLGKRKSVHKIERSQIRFCEN